MYATTFSVVLVSHDLELVERIVASLVDAWMLARRAEEKPREEERQRRVIVPVRNQTLEQIRSAQHRRIEGCRSADDDVVAAAGSGVAAVGHEFVGAKPAQPRLLVERARHLDRLAPR